MRFFNAFSSPLKRQFHEIANIVFSWSKLIWTLDSLSKSFFYRGSIISWYFSSLLNNFKNPADSAVSKTTPQSQTRRCHWHRRVLDNAESLSFLWHRRVRAVLCVMTSGIFCNYETQALTSCFRCLILLTRSVNDTMK